MRRGVETIAADRTFSEISGNAARGGRGKRGDLDEVFKEPPDSVSRPVNRERTKPLSVGPKSEESGWEPAVFEDFANPRPARDLVARTDPSDDMILELAFAADCRYVVTHNVRHFAGCKKLGIEAITPAQFLASLRKAAKP